MRLCRRPSGAAGPAQTAAGPRCRRKGEQRECLDSAREGKPVDLGALGRRRGQRDQESGEDSEGFKGRESLQGDRHELEGRRGKRVTVEILVQVIRTYHWHTYTMQVVKLLSSATTIKAASHDLNGGPGRVHAEFNLRRPRDSDSYN